MRIGVFNDGLAHRSREQAFAWCAEHGLEAIEMGVGGWGRRAPHQLPLDELLRDPGRARPAGRPALARARARRCVRERRRQPPLHPDPAVGPTRHAALVRGAVELAALLGVDRVVTMSGCPGGRDGGPSPVFALWALVPDDEPLWEWQYREPAGAVLARAGRPGRADAHPAC